MKPNIERISQESTADLWAMYQHLQTRISFVHISEREQLTCLNLKHAIDDELVKRETDLLIK